MTDHPDSDARRPWLVVVGIMAIGFGIVRLLLDVTSTVLGTSVSCGNGIGWLSGSDKGASNVALGICGAPLHNASVEGIVVIVVGVVLLLVGAGRRVSSAPDSETRSSLGFPLRALAVFLLALVLIVGVAAGYILLACILVGGSLVAYVAWRATARRRARGIEL